jgi:hypothetical protein
VSTIHSNCGGEWEKSYARVVYLWKLNQYFLFPSVSWNSSYHQSAFLVCTCSWHASSSVGNFVLSEICGSSVDIYSAAHHWFWNILSPTFI